MTEQAHGIRRSIEIENRGFKQSKGSVSRPTEISDSTRVRSAWVKSESSMASSTGEERRGGTIYQRIYDMVKVLNIHEVVAYQYQRPELRK